MTRTNENELTVQDCLQEDTQQNFQLTGDLAANKGFLIRTSERNDKCLSAGFVSSIPYRGAPMVVRTCEGSVDQTWKLDRGKLQMGDMCLGILGDMAVGTSLGIVPCQPDGLLWDMDAGMLRIVTAGSAQPSKFCADVWDGIYQDGNKVGLYWCTDNNSHQQWRLGR